MLDRRPSANLPSPNDVLTGWGHRGYNWQLSTAVQHDGTLLHDVIAVGQLGGKLEVLLDQQHRQLSLRLQRLEHVGAEHRVIELGGQVEM